jgi:hypothetical protein
MSFTSGTEINSQGGYGGVGFGGLGGFGGIAPVGLFGLLNNRRGGLFGGDEGGDGVGAAAVLAAISNSKDATVAEGRALAAAVCDSEKTNLQQFYAGAIQAANNTQAIKDQATAFAIVADKRFDDLAAAGVQQTAAILARINEAEVQSLRDQLHHSNRKVDTQDISIAISNSNSQVQAQLQAQQQQQQQKDFDNIRRFDSLFSQVAKAGQDIINVGGLMTGVAQTANPVNVKS